MNSKQRLPGLDGLRGIAAVAVVFFHFNFAFVPSAKLSQFLPISRAYLSVDFFFMLSGFVIAHVYGRRLASGRMPEWWPFLRARLARIYPLFALTSVTLVAIVFATNIQSKYVNFGFGSLLLQPFLMQYWHHGLNWNYPSWSIGTEMAAYVAFIFAAPTLVRGRHPWLVGIILVLVLITLCALKNGALDSGSRLPALGRTFAGFGIGVLLYRLNSRGFTGLGRSAFIIGICSFFAGIFFRFDVFYVVSMACVVLLGVRGSGIVRSVLDTMALKKLGDWSYGIYLWHAPVHFGIAAAIGAADYNVSQLGISQARYLAFGTAIIVIIIAAVFYEIYEVPARKLIQGTRGARSQVAIV